MSITAVIVNFHTARHTLNLLRDLFEQTEQFELLLFDQEVDKSSEFSEIIKWVATLEGRYICSKENRPLNHVWNEAVALCDTKYIAFLNNDIRILPNFIDTTVKILDREPTVDCVVHPTNHPSYIKAEKTLRYIKLTGTPLRQGWDFTIRKSRWETIPQELQFFCGDDFIFESIHQRGGSVAYALSSPILHWQGQSPRGKVRGAEDVERYKSLGFKHRLSTPEEYSLIKPSTEFSKAFLS